VGETTGDGAKVGTGAWVRIFTGVGLAALGGAVGTLTGGLVGWLLPAGASVSVGTGNGLLTAEVPGRAAWQPDTSQANRKIIIKIWDCF